MKNENIIAVVYIGLVAFSLYLSAVTDFPYFIYFLILPPILILVLLPLLLKLGVHFGFGEAKRKREHEKYLKERADWDKKAELEKKRRQSIQDKLAIEMEEHEKEMERHKKEMDKFWKEIEERKFKNRK